MVNHYANLAGEHLIVTQKVWEKLIHLPFTAIVKPTLKSKAVVGPLFWPSMLSAYHFFFIFLFQPFLLCLSVTLFNRIIKSAAFTACFINAIINNARGSFHL